MNIIKLKDVIMPDSMPQAEYFNKYLKGRYAYWVQMRYIVSFDHMRHEGYVACEEDITKLLQKENGKYPKPYGAPCLDIYDKNIVQFVDSKETDRINNTIEFRLKNKYVVDEDITTDELKKFRTWLATEILKMDQTELGEQKKSYLNDEETHTMEYYANNMYDSTIKILTSFGGDSIAYISTPSVSSCGCEGNSDLTSLYNINVGCNTIDIYRKNLYLKMVEMFSNVDFWTQWSPEFIGVFKRYIDNIIRINLPLSSSMLSNEYLDCGCAHESNDMSEILKRLSTALQYIYEDKVSGHRNYIRDALTDWSSKLYEIMLW